MVIAIGNVTGRVPSRYVRELRSDSSMRKTGQKRCCCARNVFVIEDKERGIEKAFVDS